MKQLRDQLSTLLTQSVLSIVVPLSLVLFGIIAAGSIVYQRIVTSLLLDRDRQLASLSAARVSEALNDYASVLEELASHQVVRSNIDLAAVAVENSPAARRLFNAGVAVVSRSGQVISYIPAGVEPVGSNVAGQDYFIAVGETLSSQFSNVRANARTGQDMIVIAVPVIDLVSGEFSGALLGAVHLHDTPLGEPVRRLAVGDEGFAYLVDRNGRVIFHPEADYIGADFTDRPFVRKVIDGESGGMLWDSPSGERLVQGYAPVPSVGWGLVVREPWDAVVAPTQLYQTTAALAGLAAVVVAGILLWLGVRRITTPVRMLAAQASQIADGDIAEPLQASGILEIDTLEQAFSQMAARIQSYRAGLRRYVGSITKSQEEERRRIARDLHDETAQSLLAITRRLELMQASETDSLRMEQLAGLQAMLADTLSEVRQISRDLRPLALEDLGLVPALRMLIRAARDDGDVKVQFRLDVATDKLKLDADQELALYRITQEALNNVRKHAEAANVVVRLTADDNATRLVIADDGKGFLKPASLAELARRGSFGLMGIQERVWGAGGNLLIESSPGHGTQLTITLPANQA